MKKKINKKSKLVLWLTIIGIILLGLTVLFLARSISNKNLTESITTKAQDADPNFCQNYCSGSNRCDFSSTAPNGDPNYNDPCCQEIASTGDALACPWPQRGYCTDDQCNAITGERQRCGGPRHSWCNKCIDNKCPGYGSSPTQPAPTIAQPEETPISEPTSSIQETQPPEPTTIIKVPPNEITPLPVISNVFQNPRPNSVTGQFEFPSIQFPQISLPNININLVKINQDTRKPLSFFEYIFKGIVYYDGLLEKTINEKVREIIK